MSAKYRQPVPVFHFRPKLSHPAARSLCDSLATCLVVETVTGYSMYLVKPVFSSRKLFTHFSVTSSA